MQLYERHISKKGKVSYTPYQPETNDKDITEEEALTLCGALGITMLANYSKLVPEHKRVAKKIKAVELAIIDLFRGTGKPVNDEMCNYAMECWNLAMITMQKGAKQP